MVSDDRVMLNFSGGYDSLAAAFTLAEKKRELYLVTFKVLTEAFTFLANTNIKKLRSDFPDTRIYHEVRDIRGLQKQILRDFPENCARYSDRWASLGMWCCSCQLSMRAASIIYCLEKGITLCADGATEAEYHHSSHKVKFINQIKDLYAEYGIRFLNPVYKFKEDTREFLKDKGYVVGREFYGLKRIQPLCGFTFFSVVRQMSDKTATPEDVVGEYVGSMIPVIREIVDGELHSRGIIRENTVKVRSEDVGRLPEHVPAATELDGYKGKACLVKKIAAPFYLIFDLLVRSRCRARRDRTRKK